MLVVFRAQCLGLTVVKVALKIQGFLMPGCCGASSF